MTDAEKKELFKHCLEMSLPQAIEYIYRRVSDEVWEDVRRYREALETAEQKRGVGQGTRR